ncbi:MAG: hypothetical protein ABSF81_06930 [Bacteroidales bacterium]|jgi:hypothetical protein
MIAIILAFTTFTGVFIFFKIGQVNDLLIGDGNAILERQRQGMIKLKKVKEDNAKLPDPEKDEHILARKVLEPVVAQQFQDRLRDAVWRKDIYGIEEILRLIVKREKELRTHPIPTGYTKQALPFFLETQQILKRLKFLLILIVILSLVSCLLNLLCSTNSYYFNNLSSAGQIIIYSINVVTTSLFFAVVVSSVRYSIYKKTPREQQKYDICKKMAGEIVE